MADEDKSGRGPAGILRRLAQRMARADPGDGFLRDSLGGFMRRASAHQLPWGWLHLPNGEITSKTRCLLVTDKVEIPDAEREATLRRMGFPRESLETQEMGLVAEGIEQLTSHPTDEDYIRGFLYFWKYQAYLPALVDNPPVSKGREAWHRATLSAAGATIAVDQAREGRIWKLQIVDLMRLAGADQLPLGWIFLDRREPTIDRPCVLLADEFMIANSTAEGEAMLADLGFPYSGVGTPAVNTLAKHVQTLVANPSEAQLFDAFLYYLHYLEVPTSLDPDRQPPIANWTRRAQVDADHDFLMKLNDEPERPEKPCRKPGCGKGSIPLSVFCRQHHFESIKKRPYPGGRYDLSSAHGPDGGGGRPIFRAGGT